MKTKRSEKGGLTVSRKVGESVTLFDRRDGAFVPVVITQHKVGSGRSTIHINAPEYIGILRSELVRGCHEKCSDAFKEAYLAANGNGSGMLAVKGATEQC